MKGIGVDSVAIDMMAEMALRTKGQFVRRTFTDQERQVSDLRQDSQAYLASRFAAKEAVFKALAPLIYPKSFDFRLVETLSREDGSPYVVLQDWLKDILDQVGASQVHISITTEAGLATAFVVVD